MHKHWIISYIICSRQSHDSYVKMLTTVYNMVVYISNSDFFTRLPDGAHNPRAFWIEHHNFFGKIESFGESGGWFVKLKKINVVSFILA